MCAPACQKQSTHDTLNLVRHYLECALEHAKEMDKNESVWHPNAVPGVSVSLSNETMRLSGNAMRELERLEEEDSDEVMHKIGFMAGKLDVTGGTESALVSLCQECSKELSQIAEEYWKEKEEQPTSGRDSSSIINMEYVDIDHILKVGRDFQNTDTWRGAHYDTAKLLCDTIEHLRKPGTRNCDVYRTFDEAKAACFKDRGYCSSAIDERESTIRFMLQDVKENAFNKSSEGKEDNG